MSNLEDKSDAEKIMLGCLLLQDYLKTIKKSIIADGQDIDGFFDHYSDLIEQAIALNWKNHDAAEAISREDFRHNLKLD